MIQIIKLIAQYYTNLTKYKVLFLNDNFLYK